MINYKSNRIILFPFIRSSIMVWTISIKAFEFDQCNRTKINLSPLIIFLCIARYAQNRRVWFKIYWIFEWFTTKEIESILNPLLQLFGLERRPPTKNICLIIIAVAWKLFQEFFLSLVSSLYIYIYLWTIFVNAILLYDFFVNGLHYEIVS